VRFADYEEGRKVFSFSVFFGSSDFQFFFSVFSDFRSRPLFELNGKKIISIFFVISHE